jgi:hypothetical protein
MGGAKCSRAAAQSAILRPSMSTLAGDRWTLQLARAWRAEFEDGCACITKPDGLGVLFISQTYKPQTPVSREDLQQIAGAELPGSADVGPSRMGEFEGLHATYTEDNTRWHRFYLCYGTLLLLISYNIELAHDGVEDDDVLGMLRSLRAHGNAWE